MPEKHRKQSLLFFGTGYCPANEDSAREQAKVEDRLQTARASHGDEVSPAESQKRAKTADGKKNRS